MANYEHNIDITAKVKTEVDTYGLSKDIQKIFDKPFILKMDADTSGLFNDIRKDVGKIQGQLEKTLNGLNFSKAGDALEEAFKTVNLSGLSDQIAKAIASGAQNGTKNIEEVMLDMKNQSDKLNKQLQDKKLSLAKDWATKNYEMLMKKSEELKSPQAVVDKLKKLKFTAKDLGSISGIEAWAKKLESQFNTSNLRDYVNDLNKSLYNAIETDTTRLMNTNLEQIKQDLAYLEGKRVQPEIKVKIDGIEDLQKAKTAIQDFQALMNQVLMEGSEIKFGQAMQGIYNTTNSLQKAIVDDGENASLKVNGIKTIQSYIQSLLKALGAVKDEAGKFDFSNSITNQFKQISESISKLIPKINDMADALQKISDSSILPSSAYKEQIQATNSDLEKVEKELEQRQKRIKEIQNAVNTRTDENKASKENKWITTAKNTEKKYAEAQEEYDRALKKYNNVIDEYEKRKKEAKKLGKDFNEKEPKLKKPEEPVIEFSPATESGHRKGMELLKEYISLGGQIQDLNIKGDFNESSAVIKEVLGDESVVSNLKNSNDLIRQKEALLSQLTKQQQQLNVALAKEGNVTSGQKQETLEEEPKETPKPKKPPKNAISQEDFLNVRDIAEENAREIFDDKGYKYFELSASQAENGLAKVTAKVKDSSEQWRSFNAVITETGDLINTKFGKPLKNQSKIEDSYLDSETEKLHLSLSEQQDAVDRLRSELDLADKEKWSISVDESGFVTIQNNLQQISDEAYQAVQKFRSIDEAVDNFNIKAKKSLVSYSNEVDDSADKQLKKIMELSSSGKLSSNEKDAFSAAERYNSLNKLGISNYANLKIESGKLLREINTTLGKDNLSSDDISKVISDYERFTQILKQVENAAKDVENQFGKILDTSKLQDKSTSMLKWLQNNPLANGEFGEQVRNLAEQIKSAFTQSEFDNISAQFSTLVNEATSKGLLGKPKQTKDTSLDDAKKKAEQAKKILDSLNDHSLAANMEAVNNKVRKFTDVGVENDDLNKAVEDYKAAYKKLVNIQQDIASGRTFNNSIDDITSSMKAMTDAMDIAENKMKELKSVKDTLTEVDKIVTNWGKTQNDIKRLENLFTPYQLGGKTDSTQNQIFTNMQSYLKAINDSKYIDRIKSGEKLNDAEIADLVNTYHQLTSAIKDTDVAIKSLKQSTKGMLTESDKIVSANKIEKWLEDNSRAAKEYGEELKRLADQMRNASTVLEKEGIMNKFNQITSEAGAKGLTGRSWWGSLKETFSHISQIFGSYQLVDIARDAGQKMIQYSRDVDSAMTQLRMATGITKDDAKDLMETYSQMGDTLAATGTEVAASTTEWLSL